MILILLAIPVFLYIGLFYLVRQSRLPPIIQKYWHVACLILSLAGTASAVWILSNSQRWENATEIAWTGVESTQPNEALVLGGARDQSTIGWPNGMFSPELRFDPAGIGYARLSITRGGAFVRYAEEKFLNGAIVPDGGSVNCQEFQVQSSHRFWFFGRKLQIVHPNRGVIAEFPLRGRTRKDRVLALETALDNDLIQLRRAGDAVLAAELENWASRFRLLVSRKGEIRLLDQKEISRPIEVRLPADFTILWPNLNIPISVRPASENKRLRLVFLPPFRLASPIPPPAIKKDSDIRLTVTGRAQPGDTAFLLPLGGGFASFRETIPMPGGKFGSEAVASSEVPIWRHEYRKEADPDVLEVTSKRIVRVGNLYNIGLATIRDLPQPDRIWLAFGIAVIGLIAGLFLAYPTIRSQDGWILGGIVTALWSLLVFRFILAYRYAMDPARLDSLAVSGMTTAVVALALVPGLVLLIARLARDRTTNFSSSRETILAFLWTFLFLIVLISIAIIESRLVVSFWPNARAFAPSLDLGDVLLFALGAIYLFGYIFYLYVYNPDAFPDMPDSLRKKFEKTQDFFFGTFDSVHLIITEVGRWIWSQIGWITGASDRPRANRSFWIIFAILMAVEAIILCLSLIWKSLMPSGSKFLQEILAPLLFCWIPAFIWLSSRLRFPAGKRIDVFRWGRAFFLAVAFLLVPVFLLPLALRDAGSLVSTLSVFLPVVLVLSLGRFPLRVGFIAFFTLLLALSAAGIGYLNIRELLPQASKVGEMGTRLLVFREDRGLQKFLVYFPVSKDASTDSPTFQSLSSGLQHTWENRAMVYEGGWTGLGFGNAPTTLSQVRQDTIQFDSTFSFFVASENGLIGGLLLLLIYTAPLVLVLWGARSHFDIGHGVAIVISSAFFLEALIHALMNLAELPFAGRSLPLLSVNSSSDLLRWTILFGLAVQALQWRVTGGREGYSDACSLLSGLREPESAVKRELPPEHTWFYWPAMTVISILLLSGFGWVTWKGGSIINNPSYANAFDWSDLLGTVRKLANANQIRVNQSNKNLYLDNPELESGGSSLLEQEIARFNALSENEKLEGSAPSIPTDFRQRFRQIASLKDYDRLLADLRALDSTPIGTRRPSLFRLVNIQEFENQDNPIYRVEPNPAFNTRLSFRADSDPEEFPTAVFNAGATGAFVVRGPGFEFDISNRPAKANDPWRKIHLEEGAGGGWQLFDDEDVRQTSPQVRITVKARAVGSIDSEVQLLGEFERNSKGELLFRPGKLPIVYRQQNSAELKVKLLAKEQIALKSGDSLEPIVAQRTDLNLLFRIHRVARGAIIGPAWYRGSWHLALNPNTNIPWTAHYLSALSSEWSRLGGEEASNRYGKLTLDERLHEAAVKFAVEQGRLHYSEILAASGRTKKMIPPSRIALAVLHMPGGEVLSLGGWPRMTSNPNWVTSPDGELIPPVNWVEQRAPETLRERYHGDRNFDRLVVGSASKPLWATAALAVHQDLDRILAVTGPVDEEEEVFGINVSTPWHVGNSISLKGNNWVDFASFLAKSDNRYQVRLGFLGLALSGSGGPEGTIGSPSEIESMDGGNSPWRRYPRFPRDIEFNEDSPSSMRDLHKTDLANHLHRMYSIGASIGQIEDYRLSFWSGNEADDRPEATDSGSVVDTHPTSLFRSISPEAAVFAFERIATPRQYISLLLGGGTNLWSNVDLAAAFGTCITGKPLIAHITSVNPVPAKSRETFENVAKRLHPGLQAVVDTPGGTANNILSITGALAWIRSLSGIKVYAKTGTLASAKESGLGQMSRILLALMRPTNDSRPPTGLVFSMVVESAEIGTATRLLGEFMIANRQEIERLLNSK